MIINLFSQVVRTQILNIFHTNDTLLASESYEEGFKNVKQTRADNVNMVRNTNSFTTGQYVGSKSHRCSMY